MQDVCGCTVCVCVNAVQFQSSVSLMAEIAFLFFLLKNGSYRIEWRKILRTSFRFIAKFGEEVYVESIIRISSFSR